MKQLGKSALALLLALILTVSPLGGLSALAAGETYAIKLTEERLSAVSVKNDVVYKMVVNAKGYASTGMIAISLAYDDTNITPIDAGAYIAEKTTTRLTTDYSPMVNSPRIPSKGAFSTVLTSNVDLASGMKGISISVANTSGIDITTGEDCFEFYYVVTNPDNLKKGSIKLATSDADLQAINGNANGAAAFISAKDLADTYAVYKPHTGNTTFKEASGLTLTSFTYTNSTVQKLGTLALALDNAAVTVGAADVVVTPKVTGTDTEGDPMTPAGVTYTFEPAAAPTGVSIDPTTGVVTVGKSAETCAVKVTAQSDGVTSAPQTINITRDAAVATTVTITGGAETIEVPTGDTAKTETYIATVTDQYGATMPSAVVTWSATPAPAGVTIDASTGVVSVTNAADADRAGITYKVTATCNGKTGTKDVRISRAAQIPTTVTVSGADAITVPTGEPAATTAFTAKVVDQYGVEMTGDGAKVTWSGTTPAPAGVSIDQTTGVVSVTNAADPTGAGVAYEVKATCGTATATKAITIKRATAAATTVQVKRGGAVLETATDTIVIPVAGAAVYTYSAVLLDQYGAEMTGTPVWSSASLPTGVTVDNTAGTITVTNAAAKGSLTLTATIGGVAATITVAVTNIAVDWTGVDAKLQAANLYTYGDKNSNPGALGNGTATAGDATLNGAFTYKDGENVQKSGSRNITVVFEVTSEGAYKGIQIEHDVAVTIAKRPITVKLTDKTKAYGADNPALTFTVPAGALVGTDTVDVLAITGACAATTTSPAGTPVDITGTSAAADYIVTITAGKLTITPATITGITTAAPAHTVLANAAENTNPAALKAIAKLPANVTVKYGTNSTAELGITWAESTDTFNIKGGVYTYKGTVTNGTNFEAYATTLDAKVTVTPVNGTISKVDGADASALKTPVTVAKAKASTATDYAALKLPASIELTFDGGVTAATYNNLTFSVSLDTLKAAAVDSTTKVSVTSIPAWVTIDPAKLAVDVKITAKYPVTVTVTPPTGVTYGTALGDPTATQVADQDGTDTGTVTWTYLYEGTTTAGVAYSSAEKPTQAGTYTVTATLVSTTHAGSQKSASFTIAPKPLAESMITVTGGTYTYTGKPIIPTYTVKDAELLKASDYKAVIADNINAGTAKITITAEAKGNYSGTAAKTFTIAKASIAAFTPTITGIAQVGTVLTANLSDVADSELTWQWMRAGTPISNAIAKTYTLTAADSNQAITVKAAGASAGNYSDTSITSTAVTVAKMAISGAVSIAVTNGTSADVAKVDAKDTLTATITAILPAEAQDGATYQWYRNGTAIKTATAAAYTVVAEDAAAVLKVVVTPAANFTGTAEASVEVGKTALTGTLALSGTEAVGETLTATYSNTTPKLGTDYTITWMRNGTAIPGAGTMTYVITAADQGKSITAKVTAKGATYTGEILSDAKAILAAKPAAPAVTASAGDKQVTFSWTAPADNGAPITGYVITISGAAVNVGPDVLTYTATGLTNGTACTATVAAVNSVGTGDTGTATATPAAPVTPPTPTPPPTPDDGGNTNNGGNGNGSGGNGGGEASTGNKTETVQNADGSTTTTVTNLTTGAVTQTTRNKDGSRSVVETKKNGTVTTTDILKNGVKSITVATPDGTTTATVDLPAGVESARIALPVEGASAGTVVVLIHADGTRELIRKSMIKDGKLLFTLNADAKLEILDNAKSFPDTQHHWAKEAIAFATAHELFSGVTDKRFDPNRDMNRAMLATVLYRLEGTPKAGATSFADVPQDSYYAAAAAWAMENGILLGNAQGDLDPDSSITREAMVTMLYRYAKGSPAAEGLGAFHDAGAVSGFAQEAMSWGVANGIITGKAGGKLDPKGTATRGEVATMLQRFVGQLVK